MLFVMHVFSKHGVPAHVTCDRESEFVSQFFRSLGEALDMRIHFTSGYHPKGNGQMERLNQTLEQYICIYCNYQQDNWSELLLLAEFAYHNAPSATTGVSPFYANKGTTLILLFIQKRNSPHSELRNLRSTLRSFIRSFVSRWQLPSQGTRVQQTNVGVPHLISK